MSKITKFKFRSIRTILSKWLPYFPIAGEWSENGMPDYEPRKYTTPTNRARPIDDEGDARARSTLEVMYMGGEGIPQNAFKWRRERVVARKPVQKV